MTPDTLSQVLSGAKPDAIAQIVPTSLPVTPDTLSQVLSSVKLDAISQIAPSDAIIQVLSAVKPSQHPTNSTLKFVIA